MLHSAEEILAAAERRGIASRGPAAWSPTSEACTCMEARGSGAKATT